MDTVNCHDGTRMCGNKGWLRMRKSFLYHDMVPLYWILYISASSESKHMQLFTN